MRNPRQNALDTWAVWIETIHGGAHAFHCCPARRHMYRMIADIIGDIAKIEDLSGCVWMRRDDGKDDVLLFVKS